MGKRRLLVVDDEVVITMALEAHLKAMGHEVVGVAHSGETSIDMARRLHPDLVLMDIVMPGTMDGIGAAAVLRTQLNIPVVFLTAYTDDHFIERAKMVDPSGYIVKPFQERELRAVVEIALFGGDVRRRLRESQVQLLVSHERLRHLLATCPAVISIREPSGSYPITFISENVKAGLGCEPREFLDEPGFWASNIHPEDVSRVLADLARLPECGDCTHEYRIRHKNGSYRWVRDQLKLIRDEQGNPLEIVGGWLDITERRATEEALAQERYLMDLLMDTVPDHIYFKDRDSRFIRTNRAHAERFGLSDPAQAVGKSDFDFFSAEHAWQAFEDEQQIMRTGRALVGLEEKETWPDGSETWVSTTKMPLRDRDDRLVGTFGISRDITERKRAEEAMRESETRYHELFDNISSGVAIYQARDNGNDFVFKDFNKAGERVDGDRREDLVGKSIYEARPGIAEFGLVDVLRRVWKTGIAEHFPAKKYQDERLDRWYENYVYRLPTGELVAVFDDITERKRTEEALREGEQKLTTLFELSPVGISVLDVDNKVAYANPALGEILGITREGLLQGDHGKRTYLRPDGTRMSADEFASRRAIREQQVVRNIETGVVKEDGQVIWVNVSAAPVTFSDWRVVIITNNITERKRAEEVLHALPQYIQTAREDERARLAREMHDDLGQALTALKMDVAWLAKRLPTRRPELREKTDSMSALLDATMRTVRRIATELRPGVLDDLGLVAAIEWQAQDLAGRTGLECELYLTADDSNLEHDLATGLFRVFQEVLTNVTRHAAATRVIIALEQKPDELVLTVRDNGRGITAEQIADPRSLGLVGMRERMRFFGGDVALHGVPGESTTVTVRLPLSAPGGCQP